MMWWVLNAHSEYFKLLVFFAYFVFFAHKICISISTHKCARVCVHGWKEIQREIAEKWITFYFYRYNATYFLYATTIVLVNLLCISITAKKNWRRIHLHVLNHFELKLCVFIVSRTKRVNNNKMRRSAFVRIYKSFVYASISFQFS